MYPRLTDSMNCVWYLLIVYSATVWIKVESISVRNPPKQQAPGIEAQSKFFQDFFSVQLSPYKIEFGHVCEDPNTWEQRYEKKDYKNHRDMGKVRWGDKEGGYGEHYWDLNHAGAGDDNGDDGYDSDNNYSNNDGDDSYDEPSENSPQYEKDETVKYDHAPKYDNEDGNRNKRAHSKSNNHKKVYRKQVDDDDDEDEIIPKKNKERKTENKATTEKNLSYEEDERPPKRIHKVRKIHKIKEEDSERPDNGNVKEVKRNTKTHEEPEKGKYLPYEQGSGVRQHYNSELATAASIPRLFWEPSTGHVVDRATGQAYVLQPIALQQQI